MPDGSPHRTRESHKPLSHHSSTESARPRTREQPAVREVALAGRQIRYQVRISDRATRLRITIRPPDDLIVTLPRRVTPARAEELLREKASWVLFHLDRMAQAQVVAPSRLLGDGALLDFAGETLRLALVRSTGTRTQVKRYGEMLVVHSPEGMATSSDALRGALEAWYRRQAHEVFAERLTLWNRQYGFTYTRIAIKEQKSRWGSCSRRGNLNFNWRLLLAPLDVLDYVAIHELCHLREMNHSERFWALVSKACPQYRERRRWLRSHGYELSL